MRYFFLMLAFLLVCFGLTFSVLMSPVTTSKLNLVSLVGTAPGTDGQVASSELQVFGSLEVGDQQSGDVFVDVARMSSQCICTFPCCRLASNRVPKS